jgi:hypothetical protein
MRAQLTIKQKSPASLQGLFCSLKTKHTKTINPQLHKWPRSRDRGILSFIQT